MSMEIGLEIEYPREAGDRWANRGRSSNDLCNHVRDRSWPLSGRPTYDGTVGLEVVSEILDVEEAAQWYNGVLDYIRDEYGERYAPCGILRNGNTAGLHMHLSPLRHDEARKLFEWSQEPWMQLFVCTSVAENEAPTYRVFRSNYCNMSFNSGRYDCMNNRGGDHWEWRLPEPMGRDHIEVVMDFLKLFSEDPETAKEFALEQLEENDRITSIRRAQTIGEEVLQPVSVIREAHPSTQSFYEEVYGSDSMPYIHRVDLDDTSYYAFHSTLDDTFSVRGVRFDRDTVLDANTLRPVRDPSLQTQVENAIENWQETSQNPETTQYLKEILKKKS